ncbi:TPA: tRNA 2-selenouridine(34) synthase MnmH [Campylobacter coli]|nr:tRNA 2-selenouridine(34) synthase MnmH [Campylobacter coli]
MLNEVDFAEFQKENFSLLIDARSPREFLHSHLIGALNFYALNDEEYQEIGTIYKKNQALAKARGASYICQNMSKHILELAHKFRIGDKIGIYCSRGGLRSKSIAVILSELGYRVVRLKGGFKAYRSFLAHYFDNEINLDFFALCGNTGCGKTELLELLPHHLNLEKMANHLGSSFGDILGAQPTQKAFEANLFYTLNSLKDFIFIESESRKIGEIVLPLKFKECLAKISPYISVNFRQDLLKSYEQREWQRLIALLLAYYDKSYKKPQKIDFELNTDDIFKAKEELLGYFKTQLLF